MNPMRFPYPPTDRQPIFTSLGASPPLIPRVKSQVTVSGDRFNSSAISFSERPFSLYSMALFAIEFTSFIGSPTPLRTMRDAGYQDIGLVRGLCRNRRGAGYNPTFFRRPSSLTLWSKISRMYFIGSAPAERIVSWKSLFEYDFPTLFFTSLRSSAMRYLPIR